MHAKIRKARQRDKDCIVELWKQFIDFHKQRDAHFSRSRKGHLKFKDFLSKKISARNALVLVAQINRRVVGYVIASIDAYPPVFVDKHYGAIYDLMVDSAFRRRGIGRRLFSETRKWFRKKGMKRIELSVAVTNLLAMRFWKEMGFKTYLEKRHLRC